MGYTTDFTGEFTLDKPLTPEHLAYLVAFNESRRMKRDSRIAERLPDPVRLAAGLPIGDQGEYFVGTAGEDMGQWKDASVLNSNAPPESQPGLWCQWTPNEEGTAIVWDGGEKFYAYAAWLEYIVEKFLRPWGYVLNGKVRYQGEDSDDRGIIRVKDNKVASEVDQVVNSFGDD